MNGPLALGTGWTRRNLLLVLIGYSWTVFGLGVLVAPTPDRFGNQAVGVFDAIVNSPWAGCAWMFFGLSAITSGFVARRHRHPYGWGSILLPPFVWTCLHTVSWATWMFTGGDYGNGRSWVAATAWFGSTCLVAVVAGWPDVPPAVAAADGDDEPDGGR